MVVMVETSYISTFYQKKRLKIKDLGQLKIAPQICSISRKIQKSFALEHTRQQRRGYHHNKNVQSHLKDRASLQLYSCDIDGVSTQQWLNKLLWSGARKAVLLLKVRKRRSNGPFLLRISHTSFSKVSEMDQWCDSVADTNRSQTMRILEQRLWEIVNWRCDI